MQTHRLYSPQQIAALTAGMQLNYPLAHVAPLLAGTIALAPTRSYGSSCPWPGATHARARRSHISGLRRDYVTQRDARGRYDTAGKRIDVRPINADGFRQ